MQKTMLQKSDEIRSAGIKMAGSDFKALFDAIDKQKVPEEEKTKAKEVAYSAINKTKYITEEPEATHSALLDMQYNPKSPDWFRKLVISEYKKNMRAGFAAIRSRLGFSDPKVVVNGSYEGVKYVVVKYHNAGGDFFQGLCDELDEETKNFDTKEQAEQEIKKFIRAVADDVDLSSPQNLPGGPGAKLAEINAAEKKAALEVMREVQGIIETIRNLGKNINNTGLGALTAQFQSAMNAALVLMDAISHEVGKKYRMSAPEQALPGVDAELVREMSATKL